MGLFRKTTALPPLSREQALACIPVRNHAIQASQTPEGMVRLRYPLILKPWIAELAQRFRKAPYTPPSRQLELDELDMVIVTTADNLPGLSGEESWQKEGAIIDVVGRFIKSLPAQ